MSPKVPPVSIVIPTRNNVPMLGRCLEALVQTLPDGSEVIVVANGEEAGVLATLGYLNGLAKTYPYKLIGMSTRQLGFAHACNMGLKQARGDILVVLNDDTIPSSVWYERLQMAWTTMEKESPDIKWGYAGPTSNCVLRAQQLNPKAFTRSNDATGVEETQATLDAAENQAPLVYAVGIISGMCLAMTRACYKDVGDFHVFGMGGCEDNDWCLRAHEKGYLGLLATRSFVFHFGHTTLDRYVAGHQGGVEHIGAFMKKWYKPSPKTLCVNYRVQVNTDEAARHFVMSLKAAQRLADWAVVFDDHSTIDLPALFEREGLASFIRSYMQNPDDDSLEARDRNRALQMARHTNPDWIWNLDHDEVPHPKATRERMQELLNPVWPQHKLYTLPIYTLWRGEDTARVDGPWGAHRLGYLFKNDPCWGDIRPYGDSPFHCRRVPIQIPPDVVCLSAAIPILHYGYTTTAQAHAKAKYYNEADKVKDPQLIGASDYSHLTNETRMSLVPIALDKPVPSLSMLYLARNESLDVLKQIQRYSSFADKMLFVDTGSTDQTIEICQAFNIPVLKYRCCDKAENLDHMLCDFAAARNFALDHAETDYVFFLDPDEEIEATGLHLLDRYLLHRADAYFVKIRNFNQVSPGEVDQCYTTVQPRLFRKCPELRYNAKVHETLEKSLESHPHLVSIYTDLQLLHYGFIKTQQTIRLWRNAQYAIKLQEILAEDPKDYRALFALAIHLNELGEYEAGDAMLQQVVGIQPSYFSARWELALRQARKLLDLLLDAGPLQLDDVKAKAAQQMVNDLGRWFPTHPKRGTRFEPRG